MHLLLGLKLQKIIIQIGEDVESIMYASFSRAILNLSNSGRATAPATNSVIFDSINGLYNTLSNDADSGRLVNSILMLLARNISFSNSILIISALAGKKENDWVLPNGRQILENDVMKKFVISDRSKIIFEN